jgi:hypothetical protein
MARSPKASALVKSLRQSSIRKEQAPPENNANFKDIFQSPRVVSNSPVHMTSQDSIRRLEGRMTESLRNFFEEYCGIPSEGQIDHILRVVSGWLAFS